MTTDYSMRGDGAGLTTIKRIDFATPTQAMFNMDAVRDGLNISIENITFDANGTNHAFHETDYYTSAAVDITALNVVVSSVTVDGCEFNDNTADGVRLAATGSGGFDSISLTNNTGTRLQAYTRSDMTITANFNTLLVDGYYGDSFEIETEVIDEDFANSFTISNVDVRVFDVNIKDAVPQGIFPEATVYNLTVGARTPPSGLFRRHNLSNVDVEFYNFDVNVSQQIYVSGIYNIHDGEFRAADDWVEFGDNTSESLINERGENGGSHVLNITDVVFSAADEAFANGFIRYYRSDRVAPTGDPEYEGALFTRVTFNNEDAQVALVANGTYSWQSCEIAYTGSSAAIECGNLNGYVLGPDETYHTIISTVADGNLYSTAQHSGSAITPPLTLTLSGNTIAGTELILL